MEATQAQNNQGLPDKIRFDGNQRRHRRDSEMVNII
jgi:hypothetical protein